MPPQPKTTPMKLWDVVCSCGFQSSARKERADADKVKELHEEKHPGKAAKVRELAFKVDEFGRVVPPVQVS